MKFLSKIKESDRAKMLLQYTTMFFFFLLVFLIASFGEKEGIIYQILVYGAMVLLGVSSIGYCYLFDDLRIGKFTFFIFVFPLMALPGTIQYSHKIRPWLSLVLLAFCFLCFLYTYKTIKDKKKIFAILSVGLFLFSIYYIIHYGNRLVDIKTYTDVTNRLGSDFENPNGISANALVGVSSSLYIIFFGKRKIRFAFILPALTITLVGLTTQSRTFIIAIFLFVLIFIYFKFKNRKWIYFIVLGGIIALGILLINLPFMSAVRSRLDVAIQTILGTATKPDTSTLERVLWMDYGFILGSKNLFFGYGAGGFAIYSGIDTYSHSNFAELLCDFGLLGFITFYLPLFVFFIRAILKKKIDKKIIFAFFAYYVIVSFSNVFYYRKFYYIVLAVLYYLSYLEEGTWVKAPLVNKVNKITFVCDTMGSGGAERVIATLSNELANRRVAVSIIGVGDFSNNPSFYELKNGVNYITLSNNGKRVRSLKRIVLLRKAIKNENPDVVISFLPNANIYTMFAIIFLKIPHIVSERNNPYTDPKSKIERLIKKISFISASGCVFQTKDAMNYYPNTVQKKSVLISNPLSLNYISEAIAPVKRNNVVISVGRLTEQKNYKCLLDAFKLFNDQNHNAFLLKIVGDGVLRDKLIEYSKEIGIYNYVNFVGNDKSWHEKEYNDAMFVLSSNYEGMPNALLEAMALGIPCISTNCPIGGPRELIQDGVNGYLVPVNDPFSLANKMNEVVKQSSNEFYNNTRSMLKDYSCETITNNWVSFIEGLTKKVYE